MSNIYIQEPPTSAKVLLKTTVGDIEIELWAKETPKTCRNFIQLCMEGYYNNTIFHRVVRGFIVQGGDPNSDGSGGESIYGGTFKDEFHQRLRYNRRGLVGMANAGRDDNGSQFFFTLDATPELQNKNTLFGKIVGDTLFNMLRLAEGVIENDRPEFPNKILKTEVLSNPFDDIVPRISEKEREKAERPKKEKSKGVKNFKLLSFGAEAEEDEEETIAANEKFSGKSKSTHDILDDPKLSTEPVVDAPHTSKQKRRRSESSNSEKSSESDEGSGKPDGADKKIVDDEEENISGDEIKTEIKPWKDTSESESSSTDSEFEERLQNIRNKLKPSENKKKKYAISSSYGKHEEREERKKKTEEIRKEIENVKKEYHKNKKVIEELKKADSTKDKKGNTLKEYQEEKDKYKDLKRAVPLKGAQREEYTLNMLKKFKEKLSAIKERTGDKEEEGEGVENAEANDEKKFNTDDSWMVHRLRFETKEPVLAKDANMKDDDWFEIYDPRNPLNKRRRGETTSKAMKK